LIRWKDYSNTTIEAGCFYKDFLLIVIQLVNSRYMIFGHGHLLEICYSTGCLDEILDLSPVDIVSFSQSY